MMPGNEPMYVVTNAQVYERLVQLEAHVARLNVIWGLVGFVVTPVVSVSISKMIGV